MKLPDNIRVKRFPWIILPILSKYTAHAIYPNVYVPKKIYDDLSLEHPNVKNIAILIHEQTHIERQRKQGWILWGLKYCFYGKFRFEEEIVAIKSSMKVYKCHNMTWDIDRSARYLSSYLYLWCSKYEEAKERLKHEWSKIINS